MADKYFKNNNNNNNIDNKYLFAVFLLKGNENIYSKLKVHSLCNNGYVSQVVKVSSLNNNAMSVCSKIILQINSKISGISYEVKLEDHIKKKNLMIIGVDSSHIRGQRTGVAMVATINKNFTKFYNKETIYEEKNKEKLVFSVSSFIKEALKVYKQELDCLPEGIIIYRQGVSLKQKDILNQEVKNIMKELNGKIFFYYILVNTKANYKFFEENENNFFNPSSGLLVLDGVTNKNFFEFYIQPQEVREGTATPTCFHVAFGDLKCQEIIPKLTFDLCHLYSNWQGPVRVPHVLKAAEKLSKMTAKYTLKELHSALAIGQSYL